jgi:hypothetical protein
MFRKRGGVAEGGPQFIEGREMRTAVADGQSAVVEGTCYGLAVRERGGGFREPCREFFGVLDVFIVGQLDGAFC